jgi:hypothetical protein
MRAGNNNSAKAPSKDKGSASSATSSVAPTQTLPTRLPGYTFNNGNGKQPVVRARECETTTEHVGLNFNFWIDHNYIVNDQVRTSVTDVMIAREARLDSKFLRVGSLSGVSQMLVVSIQNVDPRELNDSIDDLPFLRGASCMPLRHVREDEAPLALLDEAPGTQAGSEQQWQHACIEPCTSLLLWMDRPSVNLQEVTGHSLPELLAKYILTFKV